MIIEITIDTKLGTVETSGDNHIDWDGYIDYTDSPIGWGNITLGEIVNDYEEWMVEDWLAEGEDSE